MARPTTTTSVSFDNLSFHAVVAPVDCKRITVRENAADAAPVAYDVAAPLQTSPAFRKFPFEAIVFDAGEDYFISGQVVGYIQPTAGTVVFQIVAEG